MLSLTELKLRRISKGLSKDQPRTPKVSKPSQSLYRLRYRGDGSYALKLIAYPNTPKLTAWESQAPRWINKTPLLKSS